VAADVLTYVRSYLLTQGIARLPRDAGSLPPIWLEPQFGTPAPGEGDTPAERSDVVIGAYRDTGIAPRRHEGFIRIDAVSFYLRSKLAPPVIQLHDQLRGAFNDKRAWSMAGLWIEESLMFRDLARLRSDVSGWTFTTEFTFERWDAPQGAN
jgi:hypothetical protein